MTYVEWPEEPPVAPLGAAPAGAALAAPPSSAPGAARWYALAVIPVLAGSTGPVWFKLMGDVSPFAKACWRMSLAAALLAPLAARDVARATPAARAALARVALRFALPAGVLMGCHFIFVAAAVGSTSFSHAIVTMNCSPLFFSAFVAARAAAAAAAGAAGFTVLVEAGDGGAAGGGCEGAGGARASAGCGVGGGAGGAGEGAGCVAGSGSSGVDAGEGCVAGGGASGAGAGVGGIAGGCAVGGAGDAAPSPPAKPSAPAALPFLHPSRSRPLSILEALGAALSTAGIVVLVAAESAAGASASAAADLAPTVHGDVLGLLASGLLAAYLSLGAFRGATPIYTWMFLLHAVAAATTGAAALAAGGRAADLVGWTAGGRALGATVGAAVVPSLFGHTIANFLTAGRLPAFTVSLFLQAQPVTGAILGTALGLQGPPSAHAMLSGPLVVYGGYLATMGAAGGVRFGDAVVGRPLWRRKV